MSNPEFPQDLAPPSPQPYSFDMEKREKSGRVGREKRRKKKVGDPLFPTDQRRRISSTTKQVGEILNQGGGGWKQGN